MEDWIKVLSQFGFPVVVSAFLLWRLEPAIKSLTDTMNKLIVALARKGVDLNDK